MVFAANPNPQKRSMSLQEQVEIMMKGKKMS